MHPLVAFAHTLDTQIIAYLQKKTVSVYRPLTFYVPFLYYLASYLGKHQQSLGESLMMIQMQGTKYKFAFWLVLQYIVLPKMSFLRELADTANKLSFFLRITPLIPTLLQMKYQLQRQPLPYDTSKLFQVCGVLYAVKCFVEYVRQCKASYTKREIDSECPICMECISHPSVFSCGHVACWGCAIKWIQKDPCCPLCRVATHLQDLVMLQ